MRMAQIQRVFVCFQSTFVLINDTMAFYIIVLCEISVEQTIISLLIAKTKTPMTQLQQW